MKPDIIPKSFVLDLLKFDADKSDIRGRVFGGFRVCHALKKELKADRCVPLDLDELYPGDSVGWYDTADKFRLKMQLPKGIVLKDLWLEVCLARYTKDYNGKVFPTLIFPFSDQKIYAHKKIFIPADKKWHIYTVKIDGASTGRLGSSMSFFIDDSKNYHCNKQHYGYSILYAKLYSKDKPVSPKVNLGIRTPDRVDKESEVALVMCPVWDITLPPISIARIASYLRSKGINP